MEPMPDNTRTIPKSARTAFALLISAHNQAMQLLANDVMQEMGMPEGSKINVDAGTITAPESTAPSE